MKLTVNEIHALFNAIASIPNTEIELDVQTHFILMRNKKILEPYAETLQARSMTPEESRQELTEYQRKLREIKLHHCDRDERNNPIVENNQFTISDENEVCYTEDIKNLNEEFSGVLKKEQERVDQLRKEADEEVEVELTQIESTKLSGNLKSELSKRVIATLEPLYSDF